jgi:DNA polymerase-3 subunit gamma/tau
VIEQRVEREESVPIPAPVFTPSATPTESESRADFDAAMLQSAASEALTSAGQNSAADAVDDASWAVESGEVRVQTELSKTMLSVVLNAEAEKVIKSALRSAGAGTLKLVLLPGIAKPAAEKKPRTAKSGSAQAKAEGHPMVQAAQRLFDAEIQTVIDLSEAE